MWPFHRHLYKGPENDGYILGLERVFADYKCKCGAKVRILLDGEVLASWYRNGWYNFKNPYLSPGGTTRKFVADFNIWSTCEITANDINTL